MAQKIDDSYILSEDGKYVIGRKNRTDSHGKPLPEMYAKRIPVKNMANLVAGKRTPEMDAKMAETREATHADKYEKFFKLLENGFSKSGAAKKAGLQWKEVRERLVKDPAFRDSVADSEMVATDMVLDVVFKDIVENGNTALGMKWLEKRNVDFRDKRESVNTEIRRVELEAGSGVEGIFKLLGELGERRALSAPGKVTVVDVESAEEL